MKTSPTNRGKAGYVSIILVLSMGLILSTMMVFSYKRALAAQKIQSNVQLNVDYGEKEEAILRSIVAITPNRAIRAMKAGTNANTASRQPFLWSSIFDEALTLANARQSVSTGVLSSLNVPGAIVSNSGDSGLTRTADIFTKIATTDTGYISAGVNRSLGTAYPPPLTVTNTTTSDRDKLYPIISTYKAYGSLAQSYLNSATLNGNGNTAYGLPVTTYDRFNRLKYPNINFGYAEPGEPFVAKRNWWAFSMDVADHDDNLSKVAKSKRDFVLSIYEIPSQLAISAASFMSLGKDSNGDAWQNVTIDGGIYAGQAEVEVEDHTDLAALASRRGMTISNSSAIGGINFDGNPFAFAADNANSREQMLMEGKFFPVSLASESGRAAFIPISQNEKYFDRFAHNNGVDRDYAAANSISTTTYEEYSVGALQCAMRLDITAVQSATNPINWTPTALRFSYLKNKARTTATTVAIPLVASGSPTNKPPPGYIKMKVENESYNFGTDVVDLAYGKNGSFSYKSGMTGNVTFNNATFGDPLNGTIKDGFIKAPSFAAKTLPSDISANKPCIEIYPEKLEVLLKALGGDGIAVNNSIVVNVDYTTTGINNTTFKPTPGDLDNCAVILRECDDLSRFTTGFSIVTNLRLYIADDFNIVPGTPPTGYTVPSGQTYYPPCSLFSPEKRYGLEADPFAIELTGQVGSLAKGDKVVASNDAPTVIRPLDSKGGASGNLMDASKLTVNLRPITHPADLPPIYMMNWLVLLEERRSDYYGN